MVRLVPKGPADHPPVRDDAEILAAVRDGDPSGAAALYKRVRPVVARAVSRILGARDADHDDLVQLSIIEIVRSMAHFRGECSLDTWTSRITARTVFRELRDRKLKKRNGPIADLAVEDLSSSSGSDCLNARSAIRRIREHLDAMDPIKAWTVVLHDLGGYDLREIAQITNASVAAVQSRLVRGRAELHELIEADPELAGTLEREEGHR